MEENWYPAENEYDPGITKEQWKEFVTDRNIFTENSLIAFACIQKSTLATCTDMAEEFGRTKNFYDPVYGRAKCRGTDWLADTILELPSGNAGRKKV